MMIALGAAKGLAFLHNAERPVIYRDFKTSNILLDSVSGFSFFPSLLSVHECRNSLITIFFGLCIYRIIQQSFLILGLLKLDHKVMRPMCQLE